jgi:2-dehydropantoate 2-reductase
MRFVIYGAGAIGGVLGAALHRSGQDVALVARGDHLRTIQRRGLKVEWPEGSDTFSVPASGHPRDVGLKPDDVVLLTMKSQDTAAALEELAAYAPSSVGVFCMQNGVDSERQALRRFSLRHVPGAPS